MSITYVQVHSKCKHGKIYHSLVCIVCVLQKVTRLYRQTPCQKLPGGCTIKYHSQSVSVILFYKIARGDAGGLGREYVPPYPQRVVKGD